MNNYYPKNWNANGYGWHNLAALSYVNKPADTRSLGSGSTSSGVSSLYPSMPPLPAGAFTYGFKQNAPTPKLYPSLDSIEDTNVTYPMPMPQPSPVSMPMPGASYPYPQQLGGMYPPLPPDGSGNDVSPQAPPAEIPFAACHVPLEEHSIWKTRMEGITGFLKQTGKEFLNAAGGAFTDAAKDVLGSVVNEIFVKREAEVKRTLPSLKHMKILGEKGSGQRARGEVQDFYTLRNECLSNGTLFEDPDFPAIDSSLMFSRRPDRHMEWLRPMEIVDNPQFFVEGYSRFDVQQGELGDCWLLAAAANLTQDPTLFFRVVPPDQDFSENYAGIFHFRFWQYGKWIDVVIDDRLPTSRGQLMYMHSTEKNEFWSALLEKAYAKLHGSYEALKGGSTCEAMEDFTGGVGEMYEVKEAPPNLYNILLKAYERNSMTACSLEADPNVLEAETPEGLIRGHAYSVTKVQLMDIITPNMTGKIPMLRLRNPWGNDAEWRGPWSDQSPEWRYIPEHVKIEIGLTFDVDGEFWISFKDFLAHFDRVEICNLSPDSLSEEQMNKGKKKWEMSVFEGEWTPGVTAGGCRNYLETFWHNPQYVITLEDPDEDDDDGKCTVIVALMQKNRRSRRNMGVDCLTIGFAIYHLTERDLMTKPQKLNFFKYNTSVARSPAFINLREVSCRFKLPPGHYLIIPSTFEPNEEGEFLIRIFSENKNNMEENDEEVGIGELDDRVSNYDGSDGDRRRSITPNLPQPSRPDPQRSALEKLFIEISGNDMEVDWMELKRILDHSMRDDLPKGPYNGYQEATNVGFVNAGRGDGGGPGGNGDAGGGSILALICGPFCKDTPIGEAMGLNEPPATNVAGNATHAPITSVMEPQGFSKDVCRSMVAMMDVDQSGKLGFEEFQTLLTDIARWKAVFKLYDRTNSGRLSAFELRDALNSAGYRLNNRVLNALAHRYGSRDGMIGFDDFIMCAVKIKTMIDIFRERDIDGTNMATFSMDEWVEKTVYS